MKQNPLRFRQVHLDFHTSPYIEGIGKSFNKQRWQEALKRGHVDSITLFSKCHHGWSYHPTQIGKIHPNLNFDLLQAQFEATKEMGVNAPIYLSAGVDNLASYDHPEWREVNADGQYSGWARRILDAGFHMMDFHSPYLDYLCAQIMEAVRLFPDCDGIFLDIISQNQSCARWSLDYMLAHGLDPEKEANRKRSSEVALIRYYEQTTSAARVDNPAMPIFHNSGHIQVGQTEILKKYFSHLELESLPTGGWGYDHFPASAKYCQNLPHDFLGMTGKFHTTWGEFGGYKHPNALRYECAAMLAFGAKCSVGDQLHPDGELDVSTYDIIGAAYSEVEAKEAWCSGVKPIADIALISSVSTQKEELKEMASDIGASRILLEGHFLFTILDAGMDFFPYKMIVLPDDVLVSDELEGRIHKYLEKGGKVLLSGTSGLKADGSEFRFDLGGSFHGPSPFQPDYVRPIDSLSPDFLKSPMVMYRRSQRIKARHGQSLGAIHDPYFNRSYRHFCSHQHTPACAEASGFEAGLRHGNLLYLAHPIFTIYRGYGAVAYRQWITKTINSLLDEDRSLECSLPSTGRVSVMEQPALGRCVIHLLYANTVTRGGVLQLSGGTVSASQPVEIIEELCAQRNVEISFRCPFKVRRVSLEPQGLDHPFEDRNDQIHLCLSELTCHQMIVLHYS